MRNNPQNIYELANYPHILLLSLRSNLIWLEKTDQCNVSDKSPPFLIARSWGHSNTNDIKDILNLQFSNFYPF